MRTRIAKNLSLTIGLLAALAIVFSHSFSIPTFKKPETHQQADSDDQKDAEVKLSISAASFPSSTITIQDTQPAICLFEIIFCDVTSRSFVEVPALPVTKFLNTVLEVIISPNAP
jgi:hypothetical protein